jgi:hypothetical protein
LKDRKVDFDIVTIGMCPGRKEDRLALKEKLKSKIFWGQEKTPSIYGRQQYSGVSKKHNEKGEAAIFSKVYRSPKWSDAKLAKERFQAREDIEVLAKKLTQWYKEEYPREK